MTHVESTHIDLLSVSFLFEFLAGVRGDSKGASLFDRVALFSVPNLGVDI